MNAILLGNMDSDENIPSIDFMTMGMFIIGRFLSSPVHLQSKRLSIHQIPILIPHKSPKKLISPTDDIYPPPSAPDQTPQLNIVGGAGTYSALGARIFSPPPLSTSIGWIVDAGTDFPPDLHHLISSWSTSALIRPRADAPTTRGWNGYGESDHRAFKYLTEKKRLDPSDLTPSFLRSKSFHLICSAKRCTSIVETILAQRPQSADPKPLFIWEPVPDSCIPSEYAATLTALRSVDIMSPNHEELACLFSSPPSETIDRTTIETHARTLLAHGIGATGTGAVVVRASKAGCYVLSPSISRWIPAYHTDGRRVVDPTGGGNGFLGGLAVGMVRTGGNVVEAARMGSVAASFCIEQVGVPVLSKMEEGERWNGVSVTERLEEFRRR